MKFKEMENHKTKLKELENKASNALASRNRKRGDDLISIFLVLMMSSSCG